MSEPGGRQSDSSKLSIPDAIWKESKVHTNLTQDVIVTTVDRATLCLMRHRAALETKDQWLAPAGLLVAILTTFATSTFKDFLGIAAAVWHAVFLLGLISSSVWLAVSLYRLVTTRRGRSIEAVIDALKRPVSTSIATQSQPRGPSA